MQKAETLSVLKVFAVFYAARKGADVLYDVLAVYSDAEVGADVADSAHGKVRQERDFLAFVHCDCRRVFAVGICADDFAHFGSGAHNGGFVCFLFFRIGKEHRGYVLADAGVLVKGRAVAQLVRDTAVLNPDCDIVKLRPFDLCVNIHFTGVNPALFYFFDSVVFKVLLACVKCVSA